MDERSLAVLEFPEIVERLAAATVTARGAALARALVPSSEGAEVAQRQAVTDEAIALLDAGPEPLLEGVEDVAPVVGHAARGGVSTPGELRAIAVTIAVGVRARSLLEESRGVAPLLCELVASVDPGLMAVGAAIGRCVEEDGSGLLDDASARLRRLRGELRSGKQRVSDELARIARSVEVRDFLQERFVTERGGRLVLAVKASARRKVRGVVHEASSSGQTLFVEPLAVVELSNRLAELESAEREEVERILRELSALVGAHAEPLCSLVEATGSLDLAIACGRLSRRWRGAPVEGGEEVRLSRLRHPLLDEDSVVPIDLDLGKLGVLVVSGPNAGGKTVTLKGLGLAALLHQAGLRPPALSATLPVFDQVLADIGDQQSIEMSLSTFSGHLQSIIAILNAATGRSLVLLDELAAGTDPAEGSALAQALLARLAQQARLTVVTTHYPELKEWASTTAGVANAATGFDSETHAPLYQLALGRPGTSHALQIAERLGLSPDIVADARARVAPERLKAAALLADAETAESTAREARLAAEQERAEAARGTQRVREREAALVDEIEQVRLSAARAREISIAEVEGDLADARGELEALREEIRVARRAEHKRQLVPDARGTERDRDRHLGAAAERAARAELALRPVQQPLPILTSLAEGDPVEAPDLGVRGTIISIDGERAEVLAPGGSRVHVRIGSLRPDRQAVTAAEPPESTVRIIASARADAQEELDVRGLRVEEACEHVRAFVDNGALAGLSTVRVVHGHGTGALRAAVRAELASHTLVDRQQPDAADGATIVHLT